MALTDQIGPEPDAYVAERRLADGRRLAVRRRDPEPLLAVSAYTGMRPTPEGGYELVGGGVKMGLLGEVEYELVITDNTDGPELWRPIGNYSKSRAVIMRRYEKFKEGDDDRRRARRAPGDHPMRREGDRP